MVQFSRGEGMKAPPPPPPLPSPLTWPPSHEKKKDSPNVPDKLGKVPSVLESSVVNCTTVCFVIVLHPAKQKSNPPSEQKGGTLAFLQPSSFLSLLLFNWQSFLRLLPYFPSPRQRPARGDTVLKVQSVNEDAGACVEKRRGGKGHVY